MKNADPLLEWRMIAAMPQHRRRVREALRIVEAALAAGPAYVAVSGGKDSVAVLGLCRAVAPDIHAWHIDSGMETPDTAAVIARLREQYGLRIIRPEHTVDEMAEIVGAWGYHGPNRLAGDWHWAGSAWRAILIERPSRRLCEEHGYRVVFTGVRADENRGRAMRMRRYGAVHATADGITIACPLARWSGLDSLAYCAAHGLPISAIYTDRGPQPPHERRTGCILGATYARHGRYAELRRRHPLVWRKLLERFPELEQFA